MGLIRSGLIVIISILLFIIFLTGNILLTLTLSLQYENVYEHLTPTIKELAEEEINIPEEVNSRLESMQSYCENYSEYVFSAEGYTFEIPCDVVSQGRDAIIDESIDNLVESSYYKEYDCGFWDCFGEEVIPTFLISEKAKNYWKVKFYLALTAAIVLIILNFFLVRKKHNTFVLPGILLIASALVFLQVRLFLSLISNTFVLGFLQIFFTKAKDVFWISLITGIVLLVLSFVLKLFAIGFNISNIFSKEEVSKEEVSKEEVSKESVKEVKKEVKRETPKPKKK